MKLLIILFFCLSSCLSFSQASWKQVGDLSTIYGSTNQPILKNLSDGRPVLISTNQSNELTIAIFNFQFNSWNFNSYSFISNISNLSADVFDETIIIGCKSTNADYGVYLYDVPTNNMTDLTPFGGTYNNSVEGTIKVTCGGLNPLKVALAFEFSDGAIGSVEYNSSGNSWEPLAGNSNGIFPNSTAVIYGSAYGIKTVSNTNTIYIVSNFNGGAGNSLRVFSKPWGSTASFVEALDVLENPTAIEINGAPFFDVSSNKGANAVVIHNFVKNGNELIGRIQSNPNSVMQTPYGPYNHAGNVIEIANTGNNSTNYVFHSDDYNPVGSFVRSWGGSSWNQIGGPVATGTISELDIIMHPVTKKPYVSFGDGNGNYAVKAFNTAPVFLQEGTPAVFCSNNVSSMLLDSLIFSDADGDSLIITGISSSNSNVVDPDSVAITSIGYNPINGFNGFEITWEDNTAGFSGTTTITISVTDGIDSVSHSFDITILETPTISAGSDVSICEGDSIALIATGAGSGTYSWDSPVIQGEQVLVENSGYYSVIGTDNNGCSNIDSLLVTLNPNPALNVPADISICEGDGVTLTATGAGATYDWSNNVINGQEFFPPTGLYEISVIGTDVNGCQGYDTVGLNVYINWFTSEDMTICNGDTLNWNGQLLDSTGSYTQILTSIYGCDSTVTLNLNVIEPNISLPFSEVCQNQNPITLMNFVTPIGGNFSGTGIFNNKFYPNQVAPNNVYTITYTRYFSAFGCSASNTFDLTVNPTPSINMNIQNATCGQEDGSATASFSSPGSNGLHDAYWSVGFMDSAAASSTISNLSSGLYFVNVNNEYGCTATAPATISSNSISITGTSSPVSCFGGNDGSIDISITNSAGIASINWSNGAQSEDLVNLMVGPYEVTVIDNNGCESIASFNVGGPDEMTWTTSTMNSSCGNADGSASVIAQGGTGSYDWEWYDSQNTLLNSSTGMQSNLLAGEYTCIMTDQSGCITTVSIVVSDEGSPEIELIDVVNASCDNDGAIDIDIISNNGVQSISWSNGDSTEDIAGLASDEYSVYVMDTLGCAGMLWVNIEPVLPETQPICLITVDTITTTNKLVWERAQLTGIASYNIYRETSEANVYQLVHSQLFDEESEWTDTVASPMVRSWRYKMTAVDSCGYESDFSPVHKTIHLTISAGIGDDVNLNWDSYEGFEYTQLKLWRVTDATGWIELTTIPANLFSYTDLSIINEPGLDYLIEIEPADLCTSEKAQDYNSSRSNKARGEFNPNGDGNVGVEQYALELVEIYPNPTSDELNILLNSSVSHGVIGAIMDAQGKRIRQFALKNGLTTLNVNNLEKGMYFIQIPGKTENNILKFVKN